MKTLGPAVAALLAAACSDGPEGFPGAYTLTAVVSGLSVPARMAYAPDGSGRLFCLELKTGDIRIVRNDTVLPGAWAHFDVAQEGERGLLGIAFDPGYAATGRVYIYYTAPAPALANRVVRVTGTGNQADAGSAVTLYEAPVSTPCGTFTNHNAGALAVSAEGYLYISTGENACPSLAPSLSDPRGKILRIDPSIPGPANAVASNPFYDDGNPLAGNDDRIYALGLRNPYGMTVDPSGQALYVTENGPDCNDEINRIVAGADYGWRPACASGPSHCECSQESPWTAPLWSVTPTVAPTGLVVYEGAVHTGLSGSVVFLAYNDGRIRAGTFAGSGLEVSEIADPAVGPLFDIVRTPGGGLYVSGSAAIYRIDAREASPTE